LVQANLAAELGNYLRPQYQLAMQANLELQGRWLLPDLAAFQNRPLDLQRDTE